MPQSRKFAIVLAGALAGAAATGPINVTTYHYDNLRTGRNQIEPG